MIDLTGKIVGDGITDNSAVLQSAFDEGARGGGLVLLPPGRFCGTSVVNNAKYLKVVGSGKLATQLVSNKPNTPALAVNGMWFCRLQDFGCSTNAILDDCAPLAIDSGSEIGVQGNTFDNLWLCGQGLTDGKLSAYCMTMLQRGSSGGQGDQNTFLNCHFLGASQACYRQSGFNCLGNQFIGGNFQLYPRNGIELVFGSIQILGTGFQSTMPMEQIRNGGWDICGPFGGGDDSIIISGCRTESPQFVSFLASQRPHIFSCRQEVPFYPWIPGERQEVGYERRLVIQTLTPPWRSRLIVCKEANSDTVFDQVKWTNVDFDVVRFNWGTIENCNFQMGNESQNARLDDQCIDTSNDYQLRRNDNGVLMHVKDKPLTAWLYPAAEAIEGKEVVVARTGNTKHQVKVIYGGKSYILKTKTAARFKAMGTYTQPREWFLL